MIVLGLLRSSLTIPITWTLASLFCREGSVLTDCRIRMWAFQGSIIQAVILRSRSHNQLKINATIYPVKSFFQTVPVSTCCSSERQEWIVNRVFEKARIQICTKELAKKKRACETNVREVKSYCHKLRSENKYVVSDLKKGEELLSWSFPCVVSSASPA